MSRGARFAPDDPRLGPSARAQVQAALSAGRPALPDQGDPAAATPRLRQRRAPRLNKTETAFGEVLAVRNPGVRIRAQAMRLELANGVTYTPDFFAQMPDGNFHAWEVKGPHAWDDAIVKIKVAAREWPEVTFWLVSRAETGWKTERIFR